jgi:hypothetical protein
MNGVIRRQLNGHDTTENVRSLNVYISQVTRKGSLHKKKHVTGSVGIHQDTLTHARVSIVCNGLRLEIRNDRTTVLKKKQILILSRPPTSTPLSNALLTLQRLQLQYPLTAL